MRSRRPHKGSYCFVDLGVSQIRKQLEGEGLILLFSRSSSRRFRTTLFGRIDTLQRTTTTGEAECLPKIKKMSIEKYTTLHLIC
jgi:hypothetical protein